MTTRLVRMLPILAMHLILCIFTSESLPMENLNGSAQIIVNHQEERLPSNVMYNRSDWSVIQTTQCSGEFCNGNFGESENGSSTALQAVRIRRAFEESGNGSSSPAAQTVRIRRVSKPGAIDNYFPSDSWTSCRVPDGLRTAEVRCKMWPSSIKCISYCVYGFTYDEGIQRVNTCKYKENKWSRDFDECMPFVDCRLKIVSPGTMRCRRNEVLAPPKCDVSCDIYEDKDPIKEQTFSCYASGKWSPDLPFCAQPRGDTKLVKAPAVIEHKNLNYP